jgi:hypothetical protein
VSSGKGGMFPGAAERLLGHDWSVRITDKDGNVRNTNLNAFAEEMASILFSGRINLEQPLQFNYTGEGPALKIFTEGQEGVALEHQWRNPRTYDTRDLRLGIGSFNRGIIADDIIPRETYVDASLLSRLTNNNVVSTVEKLLKRFFGIGCADGGAPQRGLSHLELLAEDGHTVIPGYDETKVQVLVHEADDGVDDGHLCLRWVDADAFVCAAMKTFTGYVQANDQVVGHEAGEATCEWYNVGAC